MGRFSFSSARSTLPKTAAAFFCLVAGLAAQTAGTILFERWDGITGTDVPSLTSNPNYPNNPTSRSYPALYEIPANVAENYGTRTRGYVTPPTTGNYTFWISGDDNCELWLGTNDNPSTARLIASVTGWTNPREWTKFVEQQSAPIALAAGVRYYIETRHKEGGGGDNLAVGWQGPGISGDAERPIPGSRLAPFALSSESVLFVVGNITLGAGDAAVRDLLQNMGHAVTLVQAAASTSADAAGKSLVVISSTVLSADVNTKFRDVSVPVLTWEPAVYDDMWMVGTAAGQQGNATLTAVDIAAPSHPIAAGRTGSPSLFTSSQANNAFGILGGGGVKVAGVPGSATQSAIFAYEAGASMVGGSAPARRVGFSLSDISFTVLTADGLAMFRAAIDWAMDETPATTPPTITTQPASQTVNAGQTATFTVAATGTAPLAYQWRRDGVDIGGATSASYTTLPTTPTDNGAQFSVAVSNSAGTVISANALLTVVSPPAITTQPASQTVNAGQTAIFTVAATGTAPLAYQWRRDGVDIGGATSASYTTSPTTPTDNGAQFSVAVSNSAGTVVSANALLTVNSAPVITTQPAPRTVNVGQSALFTVVAAGTAPLTYQWRLNGADIGGAVSASYSTLPATASDNGALYSVVVTNPLGSVTSSGAQLTVITPPAISTQPASQTVNLGQAATFTVAATGTAPLAYQWRKNGVDISGATSASYTLPAVLLADNGAQFTVVVSNAGGSVTSDNAVLTVVVVATNSRKLAVSGELVDPAGNPIGYPTPVAIDAVVRLFDHATAGTAMYTEEFREAEGKGVLVSNGLFVARLGEGTTTQNLQQVVGAHADLWVEITVDDGTPDVLQPRTPLTATAYSLGVTPTPSAAPSLSGNGDPNAARVSGAVGALYVNDDDGSTWFKLNSGWKRLD